MIRLTTIFFLVTGSLLAVIHMLALQSSLYWQYPWFDIPIHALGGIVVVFALATLRDIRVLADSLLTFRVTMGAVLVVALVWEAFGVVVIEGGFKDNFVGDTVLDLVMGLLGAAVGFFVARSLSRLEA